MQPIDVVLLAGGSGVRLREATADTPKPLIRLGGKTMLELITTILRSSSRVGRIVLSMDPDLVPPNLRSSYNGIILPGSEIHLSIKDGISFLGCPPVVMTVTCDIPFVTVEGIEHFLARCEKLNPDLAMPAVSRSDNEQMFPGGKRHYASVREGMYTLGNLCLLKPHKLSDKAFALIGLASGQRKDVFRLAGLLGLVNQAFFLTDMLLKTLHLPLRLLTVGRIEKVVSKKLGMATRVTFSSYAGVAFDIDTPEHLEYVKRLFGI